MQIDFVAIFAIKGQQAFVQTGDGLLAKFAYFTNPELGHRMKL